MKYIGISVPLTYKHYSMHMGEIWGKLQIPNKQTYSSYLFNSGEMYLNAPWSSLNQFE